MVANKDVSATVTSCTQVAGSSAGAPGATPFHHASSAAPARRWRRLGIRLILVLTALTVAACSGCAHVLGPKVVSTPNHGKNLAQVGDLNDSELHQLGVDQQFRVTVGPPEASLAVYVIEPKSGTTYVEYSRPKGGASLAWTFDQDDRLSRPRGSALGTVIVLHGIYDSSEGFSGVWGQVFAAAGYRTVLVDLRGHGRSTGQWMTYGVVEAQDLSRVIDELQRRRLITGRLGVFGVSYGGAVAIQTVANDPRIDAVVSVGAFASMREVVPSFGRVLAVRQFGTFGWALLKGLVPAVISEAGRLGHFDPKLASPRQAMASTTCPVLLIHGTEDRHVPYQQAVELHQANPEHSKLVLVKNASHITLVSQRVRQVRRLSLRWFDQLLAPGATPAPDGPTIVRASYMTR